MAATEDGEPQKMVSRIAACELKQPSLHDLAVQGCVHSRACCCSSGVASRCAVCARGGADNVLSDQGGAGREHVHGEDDR